MKLSYSISNMRRLAHLDKVEIRPITILLGKNSVGKSTFLRSFPLLRQSTETRTSAPILWYGDFVDFGDFKSAVNNQDTSKIIEFAFSVPELEYATNPNRIYYNESYYSYASRRRFVQTSEVSVKYGVGLTDEKTSLAFIEVSLPNQQTSLKINFVSESGDIEEQGTLENPLLEERLKNYRFIRRGNSLFSEIELIRDVKERKSPRQLVTNHEMALFKVVREILKSDIRDKRTSDHTYANEAIRILKHPLLNDSALDELSQAGTVLFTNFYSRLKFNKRIKVREILDNLCKLNSLLNILNAFNLYLWEYFQSVEYIGPARVRSERYYRRQELEVSDISPDGQNLPMFLVSLNDRQRKSFSDWVESIFGYGVDVHKTEGHVSINLSQGKRSVNIVDTGYGVSQVLPVLAQVWWMGSARSSRHRGLSRTTPPPRTLAIEQPELHLHPAHQALLADVFAEALRMPKPREKSTPLFLVETHSEALINRLGELIENEQISADEVQIIVFGDNSDEDEVNQISLAEFDDEGVLRNWPFGFFNYKV